MNRIYTYAITQGYYSDSDVNFIFDKLAMFLHHELSESKIELRFIDNGISQQWFIFFLN